MNSRVSVVADADLNTLGRDSHYAIIVADMHESLMDSFCGALCVVSGCQTLRQGDRFVCMRHMADPIDAVKLPVRRAFVVSSEWSQKVAIADYMYHTAEFAAHSMENRVCVLAFINDNNPPVVSDSLIDVIQCARRPHAKMIVDIIVATFDRSPNIRRALDVRQAYQDATQMITDDLTSLLSD